VNARQGLEGLVDVEGALGARGELMEVLPPQDDMTGGRAAIRAARRMEANLFKFVFLLFL